MEQSSGTRRGKGYDLRDQKTVKDAEGSQDIAKVSKKYDLRDRGTRRNLSKGYNQRNLKTVKDAEGSQDIAKVSKKYGLRDRGTSRNLSNLDKTDDDKRVTDYDYDAAAKGKEGTEEPVTVSGMDAAATQIPISGAEEKAKITTLNGYNTEESVTESGTEAAAQIPISGAEEKEKIITLNGHNTEESVTESGTEAATKIPISGAEEKEKITTLNGHRTDESVTESGTEAATQIPISGAEEKEKITTLNGHNTEESVTESGMEAATQIPISGAEEKEKITTLNGHNREVTACTWNREGTFLASSCVDGTACIWTIPNGPLSSGKATGVTLQTTKSKKNTSPPILAWNRDGTLLATGCLDGNARIWSCEGRLMKTLTGHRKRISCIKWSHDDKRLLTGSDDDTIIVWDGEGSGYAELARKSSSGTITGVDWKDNSYFATSSDDTIFFWSLSQTKLIASTAYLTDGAVNAFKWNPGRSLLAASSNDHTVKVWNSKGALVGDFREHTQEISSIRWSSKILDAANPNKQTVLASSSMDSTIKVWDVTSRNRLHNLNHESEDAVYSFAFSPDGNHLASGTKLGYIYIWSLEGEKVVKRYKKSGIIYDICWGKGGKIAACSTNNSVYLLDF